MVGVNLSSSHLISSRQAYQSYFSGFHYDFELLPFNEELGNLNTQYENDDKSIADTADSVSAYTTASENLSGRALVHRLQQTYDEDAITISPRNSPTPLINTEQSLLTRAAPISVISHLSSSVSDVSPESPHDSAIITEKAD